MNDNEANETVEHVCNEIRGNCDMYDLSFSVCDGRDLADRILAAHKRELAAKDDARLTVVANYEAVIAANERIIAAKDAEIARLRALVEELADALDYARSCLAEYTYPSDESGKLVAKAREVCHA